jgi:hypothetical protein
LLLLLPLPRLLALLFCLPLLLLLPLPRLLALLFCLPLLLLLPLPRLLALLLLFCLPFRLCGLLFCSERLHFGGRQRRWFCNLFRSCCCGLFRRRDRNYRK